MSLLDHLAKMFIPRAEGDTNVVSLVRRPQVGTQEGLDSASDLEVNEWWCRLRIEELLHAPSEIRQHSIDTLKDAQETLKLASDGMLDRIASIKDEADRSEAYADLFLLMEAVLRFGSKNNAGEASESVLRGAVPRRRGRPPTIDPATIRASVFRLMDLNGDFFVGDHEWNAQAKLEKAIEAETCLSESRVRDLIRAPLAEWRRDKGL